MSSWITPYSTWTTEKIPTDADFNRIEGNEEYLKEAVDLNEMAIEALEEKTPQEYKADSNVTFNTVAVSSINTGHGNVECYDMDQPVRSVDSPVFSSMTVNGGPASAHYSGSTILEDNLPIGSMVLVEGQSGAGYTNNERTIPVYSNAYGYDDQSGARLSGTWRSRGRLFGNGAIVYYLAQRIS